MQQKLRLGELCAGYNGLGMAVEEVFGATPAWFSEFDAAPSKILAFRYPDVPNYGDMTAIDWANIEHADIISGGTPCQDLSAAGKRKGMTEGTRSNLWVQMREAIAIQRPRYVVWENVRGAYSAEASSDLEQCPGCLGDPTDGRTVLRALGRVLGDLSDLGYDTQWRGLRAADVGACHSRFRVFVLARRQTLDDTGSAGSPESNNAPQSTPQGPGAPSLANKPDTGRARHEHQDITDAYNLGYQRGWEARGRRSGLTNGSSSAINWGNYGPAIARWEAVVGRRAPSPTELSGRGKQYLSPKFTEWMMGLPDGWVTEPAIGISRQEQIKACGNGVVPQQAAAALRDMLAAFERLEVA
jgi:DNA (cytosine-5)-methyltransferase 1